MLLLIDAGNTRIKWALLDAGSTQLGQWIQTDSCSHQELFETNLSWNPLSIQRVMVSNVAGNVVRDRIAHIFKVNPSVVEWFTSSQSTLVAAAGINNTYRNPSQLGSDRCAALIAAHALFPDQAFMVATCGTALTIDAMTTDGTFVGGMIAPGLKLMAQSLVQNTAQLPAVSEHITMTAHFANHTEAAIVSGCLASQVGAIEYAAREFVSNQNVSNPLCVLSGGAAKYISPSLSIPHKLVDNLVLIGLQVIASC